MPRRLLCSLNPPKYLLSSRVFYQSGDHRPNLSLSANTSYFHRLRSARVHRLKTGSGSAQSLTRSLALRLGWFLQRVMRHPPAALLRRAIVEAERLAEAGGTVASEVLRGLSWTCIFAAFSGGRFFLQARWPKPLALRVVRAPLIPAAELLPAPCQSGNDLASGCRDGWAGRRLTPPAPCGGVLACAVTALLLRCVARPRGRATGLVLSSATCADGGLLEEVLLFSASGIELRRPHLRHKADPGNA